MPQRATAQSTSCTGADCTQVRREWEVAYEQMAMDRGFCSISSGADRYVLASTGCAGDGGAQQHARVGCRYTPAVLRERALSPPNARIGLLRRGAEMSLRFGLLFSSLAWDKVTGQANLPSRVQLRAAQLRHAAFL